MVIKFLGAQRFAGLFADVGSLPIDADLVGAIFDATDTIQKFVFDGTVWQEFVVGTGEINTGANVGAGTGTIFRDKIGVVLNFKSLIGGDNITVTNNADDITITSTGTSPLTTKGDIYGFSTVDDRVPVGTDGQILSANSVNPIGVEWIDNIGEVFLWSADHNMNGFAALNSVFADFADPTKQLALDLTNITTGIVLTLSSGQTTAQDLLIPNITQADTLVTEKLPQILSLKTLDIPTITDFTNAAHDHADAAGGGTLLSTDALSDTDDIAYLNTTNTFEEIQIVSGGASSISIITKADNEALSLQRTYSDTLHASKEVSRSRGTEVTPLPVVDTDILGDIEWTGLDGIFFSSGASIEAHVNGTPSIGVLPTDLVFNVALTGAPEEGLRLRNTKSLLLFGELDGGSNKLINVLDPTELQDVATKNYVDGTGGITQRQSTDPRPDGTFLEQTFDTDTGETHIYNGQQWIYEQQNDEHKSFFASIARTSFVALLGDTFASSSQSFINLLESTTSLLGGDLVNVGTVTFSKTGFLNGNNMPFRGYTTAIFNGDIGTSLLTLATEPSIEVGTGDLIKGCFIQTDDFGTNYMLQYGDIGNGEPSHGMFFSSSSRLSAWVTLDGINFDNVSAPERFMIHGRTWHHIMYQVKRSNNTLNLFIDGNLVDSTVMTNVGSGNLNSSVGLQVGAGLDGGVFGEYFGQMCLLHEFHGADAEDVIPLIMAGIREPTSQGLFNLTTYPVERLNNLFGGLPNTGDYMTTVINTSEGIYDLEVSFEVALANGQTMISIDGIDYLHVFHEQFDSVFQQVASKVDIPLSGGSHILKVRQVDTQTARYNAITLVKREGKYNEDDECSSGIILGDSMRQYKSRFPDAFALDGVTWFQEWGFFNDAALNYAGGDHFLKRGNYKITMTAEQATFQGTVNVYFGGVKVFDDDDTWTISGDLNFSKSVYTFLEGGKTQIRFEVPPTPATGGLLISSIKFEMIDGKADNNFVSIYAGDGDWEDVQGVNSMTADDVRFGGRTRQTGSPALNDEFLYNRYFSGGTYVFDMNYYKDGDGGIIDIFLDGDSANPFVAGLDTNGPVSIDNYITRTVIIPRGNHTVHMKVVGGTSFEAQFMAMLFTQIGVDIDQSEFNSFDGQDGKTVPLASYTSRKSDNSVELFLGDVSADKFTDIIIKGTGKTDASLALQLEVNGLTANYNIFRNDNNAGVLSTATATQANLEILPTALIDSARVFSFDVDGKFDKIDNTFGGNVAGLSQLKGDRIGHWSINNSFGPKLSSVIIKTSANNWLKDTQFEILGILK